MVNNVGLRLGFIGIGQCGGNIANEFAKIGYKTVAINTSLTDLEKLEHIHKNNRLLINVGLQGAGKNPEIGRSALEEHIEDVMHLLGQVFDENFDMLFVCAGLGGGTGSGIAPLLTQILLEQGRPTGVIVTIPSDIESTKVKIVALNAFEELSHLESIGAMFVVDNAKTTRLPAQMGIKTKYNIVNENIALKIDLINKLTVVPSDIAFDARDFETLLFSRGCAVIASTTIDDVTDLKESEILAQSTRKALENSMFADTNFAQAKGCAFLFELPEGGSHYLTEEALVKMQRELGSPFEVFTGVYEQKGKKREVTLHIVAAGLPFPTDRLMRIQNELENKAPVIQSLFETSQKQSFSANSKEFLNKYISPLAANRPQKISGESTLEKLLKKKKGL